MDIRKLELLADIAETGNLTQSGIRLGYSQSGVSHTIKNLESEFGFPLLKRTNKGVVFTADAQLIMPYIRSLIHKYNQFNEAIDSINGLQAGSLVIGVYSSVAIQWMPQIIRNFQPDFPNISLQIKEGGWEEIDEWIQDGSVDFGFYSYNPKQKSDFIELSKDALYAVLPKNFYSDGSNIQSFAIKAFNDLPYIASEAGVDCDIAATLASCGVKPTPKFYCKDDHSIIAMVANGLGVSILPALLVSGYESQVMTLPLRPYAYRTLGIGMLSKSELSSSAISFIDCTKNTLHLT